jgi:hypothetical protein
MCKLKNLIYYWYLAWLNDLTARQMILIRLRNSNNDSHENHVNPFLSNWMHFSISSLNLVNPMYIKKTINILDCIDVR